VLAWWAQGLRDPVGLVDGIADVACYGVGVFVDVVCYAAPVVSDVLRDGGQLRRDGRLVLLVRDGDTGCMWIAHQVQELLVVTRHGVLGA
jgi:hypothetical protein